MNSLQDYASNREASRPAPKEFWGKLMSVDGLLSNRRYLETRPPEFSAQTRARLIAEISEELFKRGDNTR